MQDVTESREAAQALRASAAALHLAQDDLEDRVAKRTRELATANESLANEITERKTVEQELQQAHDDLEGIVRRRTLELAATNESLTSEIAERTLREKQIQR